MKRTESIDLLRGLIMIFMALDHASGLIGRTHFSEMWGMEAVDYPTLGWWFTRFVSHLCAPGFFFLMGMSVFLFAQKRMSANWTPAAIRRYFFKRGALILGIMFCLEFPAWGLGFSFNATPSSDFEMPGVMSGSFLIPTTVLYGLGSCLMICGLLWRLSKGWLIAITLFSFALSGFYIAFSDPTKPFYFFEHFLLVPGASDGAMVIYPIIPWLGVATFGLYWGKLLLEYKERLFALSWKLGLAFIVLALSLRMAHFGNMGQETFHDWISFFTIIKYPPSVVFILMTCGINLILLALFHWLGARSWLEPVKVFGQTAMFFYIAHLYFYALVSSAFPLGCSIYILYLMWALGLIPLYFLCKRFLIFKRSKEMDSLWRMV